MPNLKISQLTGGGAAQAADEFVVARSGGNNKITGANVAAAATSVGTLTSLAVSGNVTVNGNTFVVDTVNNRVGIGIASPSISPLHVQADDDANRGLYVRNINAGTAAYGYVAAASLVGALELRAYSAAHSVFPNRAVLNSASGFTNGLAIVAAGATPIEMWTNGTRRWNISSSGHLLAGADATYDIGASGANRPRDLYLSGTATVGVLTSTRFAINGTPQNTTSTSQSFGRFQNTGGDFYVGIEGGTGGGFFPSSTAYAAALYNAASTPMHFYTSGSLRATIDASGNLGLGVAPSVRLHVATETAGTNDIVEVARIQRFTSGTAAVGLGAGINFMLERADGGNDVAARVSGVWSNATSGVATGYLRFDTATNGNFTERMRVDATVTAGQTALLLWDVDNGTLERVTVGAADSGGVGFKVLRIPN